MNSHLGGHIASPHVDFASRMIDKYAGSITRTVSFPTLVFLQAKKSEPIRMIRERVVEHRTVIREGKGASGLFHHRSDAGYPTEMRKESGERLIGVGDRFSGRSIPGFKENRHGDRQSLRTEIDGIVGNSKADPGFSVVRSYIEEKLMLRTSAQMLLRHQATFSRELLRIGTDFPLAWHSQHERNYRQQSFVPGISQKLQPSAVKPVTTKSLRQEGMPLLFQRSAAARASLIIDDSPHPAPNVPMFHAEPELRHSFPAGADVRNRADKRYAGQSFQADDSFADQASLALANNPEFYPTRGRAGGNGHLSSSGTTPVSAVHAAQIPPQLAVDVQRLSEEVYQMIERKLRIERQRKGF